MIHVHDPTKSRRGEASRAFSLVELLVVIGVIVALLAILLPTASAARRHAQRSLCQSNVRQQVLLVLDYVAQNQGLLPFCDYVNPQGMPPNSMSNIFTDFKLSDTPTVITCPEAPEAIDLWLLYSGVPMNPNMPHYISYDVNFYAIRPCRLPTDRQANAGHMRWSSDMIIIYDAAFCPAPPGIWFVVQARHIGPTFTAGFLDGHVEAMTAREAGTAPAVGGGTLKSYLVDRDNRPIYYAGTKDMPPPTDDDPYVYPRSTFDQGLTPPGYGALVHGPVVPHPSQ